MFFSSDLESNLLKVNKVSQSKPNDLDLRKDNLNHKIPDKKSVKQDTTKNFQPLLDTAIADLKNGKAKSFEQVWEDCGLTEIYGIDKYGNDVK